MKRLLLLFTICIATASFGQVPSYVPTNGLVGWWPFNGNANDESGNGFNGTGIDVTPVIDRFGNSNSAYNFNGNNSKIDILNFTQNPQSFCINLWFNAAVNGMAGTNEFLHRCEPTNRLNYCWNLSWGIQSNQNYLHSILNTNLGASVNQSGSNLPINNWQMATMTFDGNSKKIYINGILADSTNLQGQTIDYTNRTGVFLGYDSQMDYFNGKIDDVGIWSRALTQQEITDLYIGCQLSVNTQPTNQTININNNAQFSVGSSDPSATYQWQTDLGVGFQNLNSVGQYSGTTNDTLTVSYVTMSNNNQAFRCIVSSGSCSDTSNVAVLTVNNNVGIDEATPDNLFSVFPNPAQSEINVKADSKLIGQFYSIYNNTGGVVLNGKINSENTTIELGNLSRGIYLFSVGENMKQSFKLIKSE